jgi:hypothetical protein
MTAKQRSKEKCMTPEDARSALVQVSDAARKAQEDLAQRQGKFAALEKESGARLFDARLNSDTSKEAKIEQDLDKVRRGVETAQRIADASQAAIKAAQREVWKAEAGELRAEVAQMWPEVEARLDAAAKLLDELREAEGTQFIPALWARPEGTTALGSWKRTKTGKVLIEILDKERRASDLETRTGIESPPSVAEGRDRAEIALHCGYMGVSTVAPLKGSEIDKASAALYGRSG